MDNGRLVKALGVFLALSIVFSGAVGFAAAAGEAEVFVPEPRPGDSALYTVREVIEDPDIARGQVPFDWARLSWQDEVILPDETGTLQAMHPLRFNLMFRQGTQYEQDITMNAYYDAAQGFPDSDERVYNWQRSTSGSACSSNLCVTGVGTSQSSDTEVRQRSLNGPVGMCGVLTDLHGAEEAPEEMDVPGYCRNFRFMGHEETTTYQLVERTVWNDRDAVVYEASENDPFRITYAEGIPFPVAVDLPLSEHIYEPYTYGRHYELELKGYKIGESPYPARAPRILGEPLPLVPRTADIQIDETGLTGFTLSNAFDAAMADLQNPRIADIMAEPGAYIHSAWKNVLVDGDGREYELWHLYATDGQRMVGKTVAMQSAQRYLDAPIDLTTTDQYEVSDADYEIDGPYPSHDRLPGQLPLTAAALARSTAFTGRESTNLWGFYTSCLNDACTDVKMAVRTGDEQIPEGGPSTGLTTAPKYYQDTVFFDQQGLLSHTWSMDVEQGSPLLPVQPVDSSVPPNDDRAEGSAAWLPPSPAAGASLGILAVLGAAAYYFWPALKVGGIGLFSRIRDDKVLDNPTRRRIYETVQADPGIHFQRLGKVIGIGNGNLIHHMDKLRAARLVTMTTVSGRNCYFAKGSTDWSLMDAKALLRAKSTGKVFATIQTDPGISAGDIVQKTGLSSSTVSYHLGKLRDAGLVSSGRTLVPTERALQAAA